MELARVYFKVFAEEIEIYERKVEGEAAFRGENKGKK
jgi:hypothetical protein